VQVDFKALEVLTKVEDKVAYILENDPASRDSDRVLIVEYLKTFHKAKTIDDLLRKDVPSMESIRRTRQKLQSLGLYPSQKHIEKARDDMEDTYRTFIDRD
jgi:hypothetical protein